MPRLRTPVSIMPYRSIPQWTYSQPELVPDATLNLPKLAWPVCTDGPLTYRPYVYRPQEDAYVPSDGKYLRIYKTKTEHAAHWTGYAYYTDDMYQSEAVHDFLVVLARRDERVGTCHVRETLDALVSGNPPPSWSLAPIIAYTRSAWSRFDENNIIEGDAPSFSC